MIHIGFSGTRKGMNQRQVKTLRKLLTGIENVCWHHGDLIGSDFQSHIVARDLGFQVVIHPPLSNKRRAWTVADEVRPSLEMMEARRSLVDEADLMILAPLNRKETSRSGTWAVWRYCLRVGRPWIVIYPDGSTTKSGIDSLSPPRLASMCC